MAYRSDRSIVEALLPICLLLSVVHFGVSDPASAEAQQLTAWLKAAEAEQLSGKPDADVRRLARRSWAVYDRIMAPFMRDETSCAKFGLIVFYLLAELEGQGIYLFTPGSSFDKAQQAIYGADGTVVEMANIEAVDASAQKQARRLLRVLQDEGYVREAVAA